MVLEPEFPLAISNCNVLLLKVFFFLFKRENCSPSNAPLFLSLQKVQKRDRGISYIIFFYSYISANPPILGTTEIHKHNHSQLRTTSVSSKNNSRGDDVLFQVQSCVQIASIWKNFPLPFWHYLWWKLFLKMLLKQGMLLFLGLFSPTPISMEGLHSFPLHFSFIRFQFRNHIKVEKHENRKSTFFYRSIYDSAAVVFLFCCKFSAVRSMASCPIQSNWEV